MARGAVVTITGVGALLRLLLADCSPSALPDEQDAA